jgi:hypothetical protein
MGRSESAPVTRVDRPRGFRNGGHRGGRIAPFLIRDPEFLESTQLERSTDIRPICRVDLDVWSVARIWSRTLKGLQVTIVG